MISDVQDSIQRVLSPDVIHSELFQAQMNDSTRLVKLISE